MGLGARTSLIIYLQPWSESIALAPSIWQISPVSSKTMILRVHPKSEPPLDLVPYVEMTLVSKFYPIWCLIAQE
jgi:hypothetical protein